MKDTMNKLKEKMQKTINVLEGDLAAVRAGRANPSMLDGIMVEYYGVATPIQSLATISVPEARMMLISVWDMSQVKAISKAIEAANLGVNPSDDGKVIALKSNDNNLIYISSLS